MSYLFQLQRKVDVSGVSGTGIVANGVIFPNGKVVVSWSGEYCSIVIWDNIEALKKVNCHDGKTEVVFSNSICAF